MALTLVWTLLIYWLVVFVACFVVVEIGQDQLYDQVTPRAGFKVLAGSLLIAMLLTWFKYRNTPASFESMFTTNIMWTVLQGIIWFVVFMFVFQFHPWHALGLGIMTMLLVSGLATMGVDSILNRPAPGSVAARPFAPNEPVRQSLNPGTTGAPAPQPTGKAQ